MGISVLRDLVGKVAYPAIRCDLSSTMRQKYRDYGNRAGLKGLYPSECRVDGIWPIYFWFDGYDRGLKQFLVAQDRNRRMADLDDEQLAKHKAFLAGWAIAYYSGWKDYCPDCDFSYEWMEGFDLGKEFLKEKSKIFPWVIAFHGAAYREGWNIGRFGGDERCAPKSYWATRAHEQWLIGFEKGLGCRYVAKQKAARTGDWLWEPPGTLDDEWAEELPQNQLDL